MNVLSTVTQMIEEYPELFSSRLHALNHLFLVIGNGYQWKDGELVEDKWGTPEEMARQKEWDDARHQAHNEEMLKICGPGGALEGSDFCQNVLLKLKQAEHAKANAASIAATRVEEMDHDFYPICEYSAIKNLPSDIKSDWKEAAEELTQILAKHGIVV